MYVSSLNRGIPWEIRGRWATAVVSSTLCGAAAPARPLGVGFGNFMGISWTLLYRVYLIIYIYIYISVSANGN